MNGPFYLEQLSPSATLGQARISEDSCFPSFPIHPKPPAPGVSQDVAVLPDEPLFVSREFAAVPRALKNFLQRCGGHSRYFGEHTLRDQFFQPRGCADLGSGVSNCRVVREQHEIGLCEDARIVHALLRQGREIDEKDFSAGAGRVSEHDPDVPWRKIAP
jgi:hypothetical protein